MGTEASKMIFNTYTNGISSIGLEITSTDIKASGDIIIGDNENTIGSISAPNAYTIDNTGKSTLLIDNGVNNDITTVLEIVHSTSGTASNGIGCSISFLLDNDNDAITEFGSVSIQSTNVASGTEASKMIFNTYTNGISSIGLEITSANVATNANFKISSHDNGDNGLYLGTVAVKALA